MACSGNNQNGLDPNGKQSAPASTNTANTASPTPTMAINKPANSAKPAESGPKRINFPKGQTSTNENFELAPNEAKQFVVGAKSGQNLVVDNGGDGSQITLLTKGKTVDVTNEKGRLDATTTAAGDFVFEVKNTGKEKIKASIKVIIENIGDD